MKVESGAAGGQLVADWIFVGCIQAWNVVVPQTFSQIILIFGVVPLSSPALSYITHSEVAAARAIPGNTTITSTVAG